jgi:hypothetical protein
MLLRHPAIMGERPVVIRGQREIAHMFSLNEVQHWLCHAARQGLPSARQDKFGSFARMFPGVPCESQ